MNNNHIQVFRRFQNSTLITINLRVDDKGKSEMILKSPRYFLSTLYENLVNFSDKAKAKLTI